MSMTTPGFLVKYFASLEAAKSLLAASEIGSLTLDGGPEYVHKLGSFQASNDPPGSDTTETLSPTVSFTNAATNASFDSTGSRPSQREHIIESGIQGRRSSTVIGSSAAASFARPLPFPTSTSPSHLLKEPSASSTSAPSASLITWGRNVTINDNASKAPRRSRPRTMFDERTSETADDGDDSDESPNISVTLKNQDQVDDEGAVSAPLLRPPYTLRLRAYRAAYANLLDVWNLPLVRCEVLKFNGFRHRSDDAQVARSLQQLLQEPPASKIEAPGSSQYRFHCSSCGEMIEPTSMPPSLQWRCASCELGSLHVPCPICDESMGGLYKACQHCGHAAHLDCYLEWIAENDGVNVECPAGCGCICSEHFIIDSPYSEDVSGTEADDASSNGG